MVQIITKKSLLVLFCIGFAFNLVWELSQIQFFTNLSSSGYLLAVIYCSIASIIDGLTVVSIFLIVERIIGRGNREYYLVAAFLGAAAAVVFELAALKIGLWSYDTAMPVIPLIGIGMLPVVQLLILVPVCIYATNRILGRTN